MDKNYYNLLKKIEEYKNIDVVKQNNMTDDEIKKFLGDIQEYCSINLKCQESNNNSCVNPNGLHINIYRNKNGNIEISYIACPKQEHNQHLKLIKIFDSIEGEKIYFNLKCIDLEDGNGERRFRLELLNTLRDQLKTNNYYGVYLCGNTGVGKTHIMSGFANSVVKKTNKTLSFINIDKFIENIKSTFNTNKTYDKYLNEIKKSHFLIIDNLGIETFNDFFHTQLLIPILIYRNKNKLPTYFISHLTLKELSNKYLSNIKYNNNGSNLKFSVEKFIDIIYSLVKIEYKLNGKSKRKY